MNSKDHWTSWLATWTRTTYSLRCFDSAYYYFNSLALEAIYIGCQSEHAKTWDLGIVAVDLPEGQANSCFGSQSALSKGVHARKFISAIERPVGLPRAQQRWAIVLESEMLCAFLLIVVGMGVAAAMTVRVVCWQVQRSVLVGSCWAHCIAQIRVLLADLLNLLIELFLVAVVVLFA